MRKSHFIAEVERVLEHDGMTLNVLAGAIGAHERDVRRWWRGQDLPDARALERIFRMFPGEERTLRQAWERDQRVRVQTPSGRFRASAANAIEANASSGPLPSGPLATADDMALVERVLQSVAGLPPERCDLIAELVNEAELFEDPDAALRAALGAIRGLREHAEQKALRAGAG